MKPTVPIDRKVLRLSWAILLGFAFAIRAFASPGPPFITDDPEPVEFRHYEVYIASQTFRFFGQSTGTLPHLEINYGGAPNLQFHVITPMAYATASGEPFNYGYGDTELGVKYRFVQEKGSIPMVGIFPLVEVPTGDASKNLGTGQTAYFLPIWLQKSSGAWAVYGGGGYWHNPGIGNLDYWFSGATVQYQVTKNLMLGGELFHTTQQVVGASSLTGFNLGGVYDFDDGHHLMMSIGAGIHGDDNGTTYVAYQWTFGPKEKKENDKDKDKEEK